MSVFDNDVFGTLLVETGLLSQSKLDRAISHLDSANQQLPEILLSLGFLLSRLKSTLKKVSTIYLPPQVFISISAKANSKLRKPK